MRLYTIGHSTHDPDAFTALLRRHGVELVADVRTVPKSRRMPHFASEALSAWLPEAGVAYEHLPQLGGFRRPARDSPNRGWENESFRGYADYTQSADFVAGLDALLGLAAERRTAVMCAEALWFRCHRRLIADALTVRQVEVLHIRPNGGVEPHELTAFAVVDGTSITYPPAQLEL